MLKHFKQYESDNVFMKSSILILVVEGILTSNVHNSQAQIIFFHSHPETYVEKIFLTRRQKSQLSWVKHISAFCIYFEVYFLPINLTMHFEN